MAPPEAEAAVCYPPRFCNLLLDNCASQGDQHYVVARPSVVAAVVAAVDTLGARIISTRNTRSRSEEIQENEGPRLRGRPRCNRLATSRPRSVRSLPR